MANQAGSADAPVGTSAAKPDLEDAFTRSVSLERILPARYPAHHLTASPPGAVREGQKASTSKSKVSG